MIRHLIRLMWNRKRQNLLLMLEICVAFLVVVVLTVAGTHFGYNALQPLGFTHDDVWVLEVRRQGSGPQGRSGDQERDREVVRQLLAEVRARPEVERVATAFTGPYRRYSFSNWVHPEGGPRVIAETISADDDFAGVLGLTLLDGRWFSGDDDVAWTGNWDPIVVNRRLALELFGRVNVAGEVIVEGPSTAPWDEGRRPRPKRVVGVIEDFRQFGEMSKPTSVLFQRRTVDAPLEFLELPEVLLLKLQPGTTAAFEEALLRRVRAVAPSWTLGSEPVSALRETMLRESLVLLVVLSIVAGAMLLMVALGLTGVVWQNVTQRMREFGLRRAQGATGADVGRQVVAELAVMTSFAIAAGCLLLIQIPLLSLPPEIAVVDRPVFVAGVLLAIVTVYFVTILCAWYPSRLATRVPPAEALRYE